MAVTLKTGNYITCHWTHRHGLCSSSLIIVCFMEWSHIFLVFLPSVERNVMCQIRRNGCNNHLLIAGKCMKWVRFWINQKAEVEPQNNTQKIALQLAFSFSFSWSCIFFIKSFVNQMKGRRVKKMRQLEIEELMQKNNSWISEKRNCVCLCLTAFKRI